MCECNKKLLRLRTIAYAYASAASKNLDYSLRSKGHRSMLCVSAVGKWGENTKGGRRERELVLSNQNHSSL